MNDRHDMHGLTSDKQRAKSAPAGTIDEVVCEIEKRIGERFG